MFMFVSHQLLVDRSRRVPGIHVVV